MLYGDWDRPFTVDLAKACTLAVGSARPGRLRRVRVWLGSPELQVVTAYRFGRWAYACRARRPLLGLVPAVAYRLWNRRLTRGHGADISRRADIGPGLLVMHRHGLMVGPSVIGSNCVLHQNVTIGERVAGGDHGIPTIGDDVWIGPGAVITGAITIGDRCTISAGAILSKDVPAGCLVGGNPARVLARDYDNSNIINFVVPRPREGTDPRSTGPESRTPSA